MTTSFAARPPATAVVLLAVWVARLPARWRSQPPLLKRRRRPAPPSTSGRGSSSAR